MRKWCYKFKNKFWHIFAKILQIYVWSFFQCIQQVWFDGCRPFWSVFSTFIVFTWYKNLLANYSLLSCSAVMSCFNPVSCCVQLTTKTLNASSQEELENRLHSLTETLIQKQAMIEALSTEKSSLGLQLERVEVTSLIIAHVIINNYTVSQKKHPRHF